MENTSQKILEPAKGAFKERVIVGIGVAG